MTTRHLMREIDDILLHRPALGVLVDEVTEFRESLASAEAGTGGNDRSPQPSSGCSRTSRPTSRFARSASGSSSRAIP